MRGSVLGDIDPFDVFDAEVERLDRYFARLTEADWERPSRCEGWRVRDVLAHLAGGVQRPAQQRAAVQDRGRLGPAQAARSAAGQDGAHYAVRGPSP